MRMRRLEDLAARAARMRYVPVLSEPTLAWQGRSGWVHEAAFKDIDELDAYEVYAAGPPAMIAAVQREFQARGVSASRLYFDSFDYARGHARAPAHERRHQILIFGGFRLQQRRFQPAFAQSGGDALARNEPVHPFELAAQLQAGASSSSAPARFKLVAVITCISPAANFSMNRRQRRRAGSCRHDFVDIGLHDLRAAAGEFLLEQLPAVAALDYQYAMARQMFQSRMQQQSLGVSGAHGLHRHAVARLVQGARRRRADGGERQIAFLAEKGDAPNLTALALVKMMRSKPSSAPKYSRQRATIAQGFDFHGGQAQRARALKLPAIGTAASTATPVS